MYDNVNLASRCRTLWTEVLCAVESRVWSINDFVQDPKSQIHCQMLSADALLIQQPTINRTLIASLDMQEHTVLVDEYNGGKLTVGSKLPFAMLGDGNVYVTHGNLLLGDAMEVARQLISVLLSNSDVASTAEELNEYRRWVSALITARAPRLPIELPIEIKTDNAIYPASTIDLSTLGAKVVSSAQLDRGNYVTVFRGSLGSFFRVVWSEPTDEGTRAGLVCLNPPVDWAEFAAQVQ